MRVFVTQPRKAGLETGLLSDILEESTSYPEPDNNLLGVRQAMMQYALKIVLSAAILVAVAELAKRSSFWAAALASLPLTSLLAFVWIYLDSGDIEKVATLSHGIFWLVLPSLLLFLVLPLLLRGGLGFWLSLGAACFVTAAAYFGMVKILGVLGVRI